MNHPFFEKKSDIFRILLYNNKFTNDIWTLIGFSQSY